MKWEYTTVMFSAKGFLLGGKIDGKAFTKKLNELGVQGWEMVVKELQNLILLL